MFSVFRSSAWAFLLAAASLLHGYDFQAGIDRNQLALGEEVTVTVQFSGENLKDEPPYPEFEPSADFSLVNKSRNKSSSQNITIINGRFNKSLIETHVFQFTFRPLKTGDLAVPGCRFVYGDFTRTISPTRVAVLKESPESRDIDLSLRFSKRDLYLNEQVVLTALIRRKANSAVRNITRPDIEKELKKFFWVKPLSDKVEGHIENIGGGQFEVFPIPFIVFPLMPGDIKVPSIPMEYVVIEQGRGRGRSPFNDPFFGGAFESFFDQGNAKKKTKYSAPSVLHVRDLPAEGRPAEFSGAVGSFSLSASLDKASVKAGEAVNLKVSILGSGNEKSVNTVHIRNLDAFEVFDPEIQAEVQVRNNRLFITKTFRYVLIPKSEGEQAVGPVSLYFFDPEKGRYDSSQATLSLKVEKGKAVKAVDDRYLSKEEIRLLARDIRYIKTGGRRLRDQSSPIFRSPAYWVLALFPLVSVLFSLFIRHRAKRLQTDIGYARSKKARKNALRLLKEAASLISAPPDKFYASLYRALAEYIANKLNVSAAGLTVPEASALLLEKGVDPAVIQDIARLLETCDLHRFSSLPVTAADRKIDMEKAEKHLLRLEEKLA
ncbi:MAG: BatD family protein [Syntrophaceae bacterium]